MSPTVLIILAVIAALIVLIAVPALIVSTRRKQQQQKLPAPWIPAPTQNKWGQPPQLPEQPMFIPKGLITHQLQAPQQEQIQIQGTLVPKESFTPRGKAPNVTGTCFLTGEPRATCTCDDCVQQRKKGS